MQSTQHTHMLYLAVSSAVLVSFDRHFFDNPKFGVKCTRLDLKGKDDLDVNALSVIKKALQVERVKDLNIIVSGDLGFSCVLDVFNEKPLRPLVAFDLEHTLLIKLDAYVWGYFRLGDNEGKIRVLCTGVPKYIMRSLCNLCEEISVHLKTVKLETACSAWLFYGKQDTLEVRLALGSDCCDTNVLNLMSLGKRLNNVFKVHQNKMFLVLGSILVFVLGFNICLHQAIRHLKTDTKKLGSDLESLYALEKNWNYNAVKIDALEKTIKDALQLTQYQLYWPYILRDLQLLLYNLGHSWVEELDAVYNESYGAIQLHLKGFRLSIFEKQKGLTVRSTVSSESDMCDKIRLFESSAMCHTLLNTKVYSKNENEDTFEIDLLVKPL